MQDSEPIPKQAQMAGAPGPWDGGLDFETGDITNPSPHRPFKTHPIHSGISNRLCQLLAVVLFTAPTLRAQQPPITPTPSANNTAIAIVPLDSAHLDQAATVTGALEVSHGKAVIVASGTITSGSQTTQVTLP